MAMGGRERERSESGMAHKHRSDHAGHHHASGHHHAERGEKAEAMHPKHAASEDHARVVTGHRERHEHAARARAVGRHPEHLSEAQRRRLGHVDRADEPTLDRAVGLHGDILQENRRGPLVTPHPDVRVEAGPLQHAADKRADADRVVHEQEAPARVDARGRRRDRRDAVLALDYAAQLALAKREFACERAEDGQSVTARVHPAMIPLTHPLASVREAYNAVFVESDAAGQLMFYGPGAGGAPTASAVLGDLVAV